MHLVYGIQIKFFSKSPYPFELLSYLEPSLACYFLLIGLYSDSLFKDDVFLAIFHRLFIHCAVCSSLIATRVYQMLKWKNNSKFSLKVFVECWWVKFWKYECVTKRETCVPDVYDIEVLKSVNSYINPCCVRWRIDSRCLVSKR